MSRLRVGLLVCLAVLGPATTGIADVVVKPDGTFTFAGGTVTQPVLFPDGTAAAPSIAFSSDADGTGTGIFRQGSNSIGYTINGGEVFRMNTSGLFVLSDLVGLRLGASGDVNLVRRAAGIPVTNVGTATFAITAGSSVAVGGVLCGNTTAQATTGTTEQILVTCTVPANALNAGVKGLRVHGWGTTAANVNSKTFQLRLGGIGGTILAIATTTTSGQKVYLHGVILRSGSNTQITEFTSGAYTNSGAKTVVGTQNNGAATDSAAIDLVITGTTPTAAGDLTFNGLLVEFFN